MLIQAQKNQKIQRGLLGLYECDHCHARFEKMISQMINKRHHFCSKACMNIERKKGGLIRTHIIETTVQKFGVQNAFQSEECKTKIKRTNLNKFGVEYPQQTQEQKERYRQKNIERWQHVSETDLQNRNAKRIQTCLMKYGVDHPMKIQSFVEKAMLSRSICKTSMKTISRGERYFYDLLRLNNTLCVKSQTWINGHLVDFFIETLNLIVEYDGDYWHDVSSEEPRIMRKVLRDQKLNTWCQEQQKHLFRIKESEMCQELGFINRKLPRQTKLQCQITSTNSKLIIALLNDASSCSTSVVRYSDIRQ